MRLFVDLETTGLDAAEGHRVIEVAAVAYEGRSKTSEFHRFVNPERQVEAEAVEIHGITNEKLRGKPKFAEIAEKLAEFLSGNEFVAHNAEFDVGFLDMEFKRCGMEPVAKIVAGVVDSLAIARELFPGQSNSLDALARRYGIDVGERRKLHGALVDAEILAEVFEQMNSGQNELDFKAQHGAGTLRMPETRAAIVRLAPSAEAREAHERFMEELREAGAG